MLFHVNKMLMVFGLDKKYRAVSLAGYIYEMFSCQ